MNAADSDMDRRIARLERKYRVAIITAAISSACGILAIVGAVGSSAVAATTAQPDPKVIDVLRVRELNIVDNNGVTRVNIGAPLVHAVVSCKKIKTRGG